MTGLIYVAIIAVWAIVLVPAWLRSHDHLESRSADPASDPELSGRSRRRAARAAAQQSDEVPEPITVHREDLAAAAAQATRAAARARAAAKPRSAAARRRVVLAVLGLALLVVGGLVVAGILLPVALAAPAALLVGFLGVARHQVRAAARRRAAHEVPEAGVANAPASDPARSAGRASGGTWEARTAPLPTYVTAPPAAGFPRVIDTATPGAWTAAAMLERAQQEKARAERLAAAKAEAIARAKAEQAAAEARSRDEEFLADQAARWAPRPTSAPYQRRRAVNE